MTQALLPYLPVRGRVITADALHTQAAFCKHARCHHRPPPRPD